MINTKNYFTGCREVKMEYETLFSIKYNKWKLERQSIKTSYCNVYILWLFLVT